MLESDEITQPPAVTEKRQSDRPKERRYRFRSKFENPLKDCPIICKKCGKRSLKQSLWYTHSIQSRFQEKEAEKEAAKKMSCFYNEWSYNAYNDEDVKRRVNKPSIEIALKRSRIYEKYKVMNLSSCKR